MKNFYRHKKLTPFILFLFVISGIVFPTISLADGALVFPTVTETPPTTQKAGDDCISNLSWYKSIVAGLADIILWTPKQIAYWTTKLSSWVMSRVSKWPITNTRTNDAAAIAFVNGWKSVKDLANMLIVLGFVVIGIATALRINDYGAKKLLPKLIIVALLINFSQLFCGVIIDTSTLTMSGLLSKGVGSSGWDMYEQVQSSEKSITCNALKKNDLQKYVMADVLFASIYLALAVCYFYLAVMLIARYAVLGILFILSPLAFVFWAFPLPHTKDLWNKWWNNFIKWAFIGVGISFFVNLAGQMLEKFPITGTTAANSTSSLIFYLSIVLMVIIVGIKVTTKVSAIGATAVMGLAGAALTGGASLAMTGAGMAAKGGLKALDAKTGNKASGAYRSVSSGVGRAMERIGLKQTGTTALANEARVSQTAKGYEAEYTAAKATGDTATVNRIQQEARKGKGTNAAAAMRAVAGAGDINEAFSDSKGGVDNVAATARLKYAESVGAKGVLKDAIKSNPNLAGSPEKIQEAVQRMSPQEFAKNVHQSSYTPEVLGAMTTDQASAVFGRNGSQAKRKKLVEATRSSEAETYAEGLQGTAKGSFNQLRYHIATSAGNIGMDVPEQEAGGLKVIPGGESEVPEGPQESYAYRAGRTYGKAKRAAGALPGQIERGIKGGTERGLNALESAAGTAKEKAVSSAEKVYKKGRGAASATGEYLAGEGTVIGWLRDKFNKK